MFKQVGDQLASLALHHAEPLTHLSLVRVVPNKRFVCRANWQGKTVYAKIFFGEKAPRYAQRDQRGSHWLASANIATPPLLATASLAHDDGVVLIYEAIERASNAEQVYNEMEAEPASALMLSLVKAVAQHHQANLIQTDLYLKNFMLQNDVIYTLDGDGIRRYAKLGISHAKHNLAILLSKFDPIHLEKIFKQLLAAYVESRSISPLGAAEIRTLVDRYRIKATVDYADKKVFRTCTDVIVNKKGSYLFAQSTSFSLLALPVDMQQYDALIADGQALKQGNTCTVSLVQLDGVGVVIKRYNIKHIWHGLGRLLRPSRASVSWSNAHRLQLLNIATPKPVALFEKRIGGLLRGKAYFLSEFVDAPDISNFFAQKDDALKILTVRKVVTLFYRLYLMKISHGDTKATNIKILGNGEPVLIDLDSMQQHRYVFFANKAHIRDLKRFMQNWKAEPALYNAFVAEFKQVYLNQKVLQAAQIL